MVTVAATGQNNRGTKFARFQKLRDLFCPVLELRDQKRTFTKVGGLKVDFFRLYNKNHAQPLYGSPCVGWFGWAELVSKHGFLLSQIRFKPNFKFRIFWIESRKVENDRKMSKTNFEFGVLNFEPNLNLSEFVQKYKFDWNKYRKQYGSERDIFVPFSSLSKMLLRPSKPSGQPPRPRILVMFPMPLMELADLWLPQSSYHAPWPYVSPLAAPVELAHRATTDTSNRPIASVLCAYTQPSEAMYERVASDALLC
jgi:hypothetical protein